MIENEKILAHYIENSFVQLLENGVQILNNGQTDGLRGLLILPRNLSVDFLQKPNASHIFKDDFEFHMSCINLISTY